MARLTAQEVEREIAALDSLDHQSLQQRWRDLYKVEAPFKIRSGFLRRAIAYRLQELVHGGLKPSTRRALRRIAEEAKAGQVGGGGEAGSATVPVRAPSRAPILSAGTQLLREWNGRMETVDVADEGFLWQGSKYRTLSAVAVAITGTKWSGPKFFGLVGKR